MCMYIYILETYVEYRHAFLLLISFSYTYSQLISYTIAIEYRSIDGQIDRWMDGWIDK